MNDLRIALSIAGLLAIIFGGRFIIRSFNIKPMSRGGHNTRGLVGGLILLIAGAVVILLISPL